MLGARFHGIILLFLSASVLGFSACTMGVASRATEQVATLAPGRPAAAPTKTPNPTPRPTTVLEPSASPTAVIENGPQVGKCAILPANNFWNVPIDQLPVDPSSNEWVKRIGAKQGFHMDFGSGTWDGGPIGIPYNLMIGPGETKYSPTFEYMDESDPGPYPIPAKPNIEYGSDHHILLIDTETCMLYEIYAGKYADGQWSGGSGAIWDMKSNDLRPADWTSSDAAGLPIFPGLMRYDEIAAGEIKHALRFTAEETAGFIWPARHQTADAAPGIPPLGARFRLKASYDISGFKPDLQIILRAMKKYGIVLADNGSNWYVSGAPDPRWDNDVLHQLDVLTGEDFEAVDTSKILLDGNSGQAKP